jgi:NAD(P)-dependent dehydrogenase (short-subunit alcohol dehydrogenase family)
MMQKYLVITGASRGIGLATAKLFLDQGFIVINLSRTPCPLQEVINIPVDLAQQGFEADLKSELLPRLDRAETVVLVHNAARLEKDTVNQIQADSFRQILEINVVAPTILNRLILPLMKPGAAIIYIGSTLSEKAVARAFSYVTSKHAVVGLMRATCQDLIDTGIHTACICPGFTDTQMLRTQLNNDAVILEQIKSMNAQHRLIDPAEIAQAIYFAASQPVLNGAVIHANLGQKQS